MGVRHRSVLERFSGSAALLLMPVLSLVWMASAGAAPPGREVVTNSIGMKLVRIPAGEFDMGSAETARDLADAGMPVGENDGTDSERPVHRVQITKPFLMGQTEVSLGQFLEFYHDGYRGKLTCEQGAEDGQGYDANANRPFSRKPQYRPWNWGHPGMDVATEAGKRRAFRFPVVNVSQVDATAFCTWLTGKEGKKYRLPTEAEWEYACRAGTETRFWTGNDPETLTATENVADASFREQFIRQSAIRGRDGHVLTSPVGSFRPNPFGLYDMHGNVSEWCRDQERTYESAAVADPFGGSDFFGLDLFVPAYRGGSFLDSPVDCRSAKRFSSAPSKTYISIGFRVVCEVE